MGSITIWETDILDSDYEDPNSICYRTELTDPEVVLFNIYETVRMKWPNGDEIWLLEVLADLKTKMEEDPEAESYQISAPNIPGGHIYTVMEWVK